MRPQLALILTLGLSGFLVWQDSRKEPKVSAAMWIPVLWIFFISSMFVTQWLGVLGIMGGGGDAAMEDGSPLDAAFFLLLIVAGIVVLARRNFSVSTFAQNNVWLAVFLVYCFLAVTWSDFPFVAFKRWIKTLGHPVMALLILTESHPKEAVKRVLARAAALTIPLSICFIKYFPDLGRGYDNWTGEAFNKGITLNKNELGYSCLIYGATYFWNVLTARRILSWKARWHDYFLSGVMIFLICWLFVNSDSATSRSCTAIAVAIMLASGTPLVPKKYLGTFTVVILGTAWGAETFFHIYEQVVVGVLGRNPTLTDRTEVWGDVLAMKINPILGAGFESFWLGPRLEAMWAKWWWHPTQAHNGYIETYLNLGVVGLFLLAGVLISTFRKSQNEMLRDLDFGRFRLAFLFAILFYNYTEAAFKGVHFVWTMFHLIAIDYPLATALQPAKAVEPAAVTACTATVAAARPGRSDAPPWTRVTIPNQPWHRRHT
jgi:O-antigen ligase